MDEEAVWYFAYGANTSTAVLTGRRGIAPLSTEGAVLDGYRLAFALPGVPLVEPAFATVIAEPGTRTEGVLYRLRPADLRRLDGFESRRYERSAQSVVGRRSGTVEAEVYVCRRPRRGLVPSKRYRDLILAGAREHALSDEHVAWLEAQPVVDSRIGRALAVGVMRAIRLVRGGY